MMDGRNCSGRTISLLNSDVVTANDRTNIQLSSRSHNIQSRASSCVSTPSPQTPELVRSSSSNSCGFSTSPLTPSFGSFDPIVHTNNTQKLHQQQLYIAKMDDHNASMYPPIPDATGVMSSAYPIPMPQMPPQQQMQQQYRSSDSPASEPSRVSAVSATSNSNPHPKKNHYPCPLAKQVGCNDFFTTSGHAARHAKKHTGKKDAYCPECNKAFTRKDNMEQHRRTHQNGRGASRSTTDDAKVKKATKPAAKKSSSIKAEPQLEAAVEQQIAEQQQQQAQAQAVVQAQVAQVQQAAHQQAIEQAMMVPTGGPYFLGNAIDTGPIPSLPMAMPDLSMRPPLHRAQFTNNLDYVPPAAAMVADPDALHYSYPSPGLSHGLNSLALAASEHRRLSEEKIHSRSPSQETSSQGTP